MPSTRKRKSNKRLRTKVAKASSREDDDVQEDSIHQQTYTDYEMRSFTANQLITILEERGVVVSDEFAHRCSSLRSPLKEVLLEEQEDNDNIKNRPSTSSRVRRETRATKKQKKDVQKRQDEHIFYENIRNEQHRH